MTKKLITLISILIFLAENTGANTLLLEVNRKREALRPVSTFLSGMPVSAVKDSSAAESNTDPKDKNEQPAADGNEAESIINEVAIDLSSEDETTVGIGEILEKRDEWFAKERPVFVTCVPETEGQVRVARSFGFVCPVTREVADAVRNRVRQKRISAGATTMKWLNFDQEVMSHPFDFGRDVMLNGKLYSKITLVTTKNHETIQLANAFRRNNEQAAESIIAEREATPIGFKMILTDESMNTFANASALDKEDVKYFISVEQKIKMEEEHEKERKKEAKKKEKDRLVTRIKGLIDDGELDEVDELLRNDPLLRDFREGKESLILLLARRYIKNNKLDNAWELLSSTHMLDKFKGEKTNLILLLVDRYINKKRDFKKARTVLNSHFSKGHKPAAAKKYLERCNAAISRQKRKDKQKDEKERAERVDELLKQGKWDEAWRVAGGPELENGESNPLCEKILETVRRPEFVPEWISPEKRKEFMEQYEKNYDAERAFGSYKDEAAPFRVKDDMRRRYREFARMLCSLDEGVFSAISEFALPVCLKMGGGKYKINSLNWSYTIKDFKEKVVANLHIPAADTEQIKLPCQQAFTIMQAFTFTIKEFYHVEEPGDGPRRLERLSGEPQEIEFNSIQSVQVGFWSEEPTKDIAETYARNIVAGCTRCALIDELEPGRKILANSLRGYVKDDIPFPILYSMGVGPYPSFALLHSLTQLGAVPGLTPSELADNLSEEKILKRDIVTTTSGNTAIRIFLKRDSYFKGPVSPAVRILYLYPLMSVNRDKTKTPEEVRELLNDWPETLSMLRESKWEGPGARFIAGGIDYEFKSEKGLRRLLDIILPDADEDDKRQRLQQICATQEEARESGYPTPETTEPTFLDEYYNMLIGIMGHYIACDAGLAKKPEKDRVAKTFIRAFFDPVYKDVATQAALLLVLDGIPYRRSKLDEMAATEGNYAQVFRSLLKKTYWAYHALRCAEHFGLKAPWDVLTSWDPDAPEEEMPEQLELRRELWHVIMEVLTYILTFSVVKERLPGCVSFDIDKDDHVCRLEMIGGRDRIITDAKSDLMNAHYLGVLSKLGYRPFIEESALINIINNPQAHKFVRVTGPTEHSPPSIVINLKKDWQILEEKAKKFMYVQENKVLTDKLVIVLFDENGKIIMDEKPYREYVTDGSLATDSEGNIELTKVMRTREGTGRRALIALPHILVDVEQFNTVVRALSTERLADAVKVLGTDEEFISPQVKSILKMIPRNRRPYPLTQAITSPHEQSRVDEALQKAARHEAQDSLDMALKLIRDALDEFPDNDLLKAKVIEYSYLRSRRDVLARAKEAIAKRSKVGIDKLEEAVNETRALYQKAALMYGVEWQEAIDRDSKGLKVWQFLNVSIEKAKRRKDLLDKAESCLEAQPDEAGALAKDAKRQSWSGPDIDNLLNRVDKRKGEILADSIWKKISGIEDRIKKAARVESITDLQDLKSQLDTVEKEIEVLSAAKAKQGIIDRIESLRDTISENIAIFEKDIADTISRLTDELNSLRGQIEAVPTREELRVLGRRLRSTNKEIEKLSAENNKPLKELYIQVDKVYQEKKTELTRIIKELKKDIKNCLRDAKGAVNISRKDLAENQIKIDFEHIEADLIKIPSTEVQAALSAEFEECKEYVRKELDEREANSIYQILEDALDNIAAMEEEDIEIPGEELRARIDGLCVDDDIKQALLSRMDDVEEAYRAKKLAIEQRRIIERMKPKLESLFNLTRSVSPLTRKRWIEQGGINPYTESMRYLRSLKLDDPETRAHAEQVLRRLEQNMQQELPDALGIKTTDKKTEQTALSEIESSLGEQPDAEAEESRSPKAKQIQKIRPSRLAARLNKATTAEDFAEVMETAQRMIDNATPLNIPTNELKKFIDIRNAAQRQKNAKPSSAATFRRIIAFETAA